MVQGLALKDQYHEITLDEDVTHYKHQLTIYTVAVGVLGLLCLSTSYCFKYKSKEEIRKLKKPRTMEKKSLTLRGS